MYAQSDVQRNRQFYLGDELPYDDFDAVLEPVAAQVHQERQDAHHDPRGRGRSPRSSPQSIELHMALKKLGVPTELFLYPGHSHGIPDPATSGEVGGGEGVDGLLGAGMGEKFQWRDVLSSLEGPGPRARVSDGSDGRER